MFGTETDNRIPRVYTAVGKTMYVCMYVSSLFIVGLRKKIIEIKAEMIVLPGTN